MLLLVVVWSLRAWQWFSFASSTVCAVAVQGDHRPLRAEGKLTEDSLCFPCPSRQPVSAPFLHKFLDLLQECICSNSVSWPLVEGF